MRGRSQTLEPKPQDYSNRKEWKARPNVARAIRAVLFVVPIIGAIGTTMLLGRAFYRPQWPIAIRLAWMAAMFVAASFVSSRLAKLADRFLPLSALCQLNLRFPKEAPSRFKTALRTGNTASRDRVLKEFQEQGLSKDPQTAAVQVLDLIQILNNHDRKTRGHSEKVRALADVIAAEMDMSDNDRNRLRWASMLHDMGKITVPSEILNKNGKPTDEEWEILKGHPGAGKDKVSGVEAWLGDAINCVWEHHERYDGTGYPHRLTGEQMSVFSRIVAVADAFEVMTATRSYKKPMTYEDARAELVRCSGTHFDPVVVRAVLQIGRRRTQVATGLVSSWVSHLAADGGRIGNLVRTVSQGAASGGTGFVAPFVKAAQMAASPKFEYGTSFAAAVGTAPVIAKAAAAKVAVAKTVAAVTTTIALAASSTTIPQTLALTDESTTSTAVGNSSTTTASPPTTVPAVPTLPATSTVPATPGTTPTTSAPETTSAELDKPSPTAPPETPAPRPNTVPTSGPGTTTTTGTRTTSTTTTSTPSTTTSTTSTTTTTTSTPDDVPTTTSGVTAINPPVSVPSPTAETTPPPPTFTVPGTVSQPTTQPTTTIPLPAVNADTICGATGWQTELYSNRHLMGPPVAPPKCSASPENNWGDSAPAGLTNPEYWSVRYTADVNFVAANVSINADSDDGVRIWVDDSLVVDRWSVGAVGQPALVGFAAGIGVHRVVVEFFDQSGQAQLVFSMTPSPTLVDGGSPVRARSIPPAVNVPSYQIDRVAPLTPGTENQAIAINSVGKLFATSELSHRVMRLDVSGNSSTWVPIIGNNTAGFSGDNGPALSAQLDHPTGIVVGPNNEIYIADTANRRIRRVTTAGIITTIAGNGPTNGGMPAGSTGDGGSAFQATFTEPLDLAYGSNALYINDGGTRIRRIDLLNGTISTFLGDGVAAFGVEGERASTFSLNNVNDISFREWQLVVSDTDRVIQLDVTSIFDGRPHIRVGAPGASLTTEGPLGPDSLAMGVKSVAIVPTWDPISSRTQTDVMYSEFNSNLIRTVRVGHETVWTVAGTRAVSGDTGDGALAKDALFSNVTDMIISPTGNQVYVIDRGPVPMVRRLTRLQGLPGTPAPHRAPVERNRR
jgi:HD-GYP domain-containing protein (c-di-GMP phosphodiesterase class II)